MREITTSRVVKTPFGTRMRTADELVAARTVLLDPARFTQGAQARAADGSPVHPHAAEAVCFCSIGAIEQTRCRPEAVLCLALCTDLLDDATEYSFTDLATTVARYHDSHSHPEVLAWWEEAIELARSCES